MTARTDLQTAAREWAAIAAARWFNYPAALDDPQDMTVIVRMGKTCRRGLELLDQVAEYSSTAARAYYALDEEVSHMLADPEAHGVEDLHLTTTDVICAVRDGAILLDYIDEAPAETAETAEGEPLPQPSAALKESAEYVAGLMFGSIFYNETGGTALVLAGETDLIHVKVDDAGDMHTMSLETPGDAEWVTGFEC